MSTHPTAIPPLEFGPFENGDPRRHKSAYGHIARAIDFLVANQDRQPSLEETAREVGLSASHFQRVFKAGAGVSPKRFLQYLAAAQAKRAFSEGETVMGAAFAAGLSGPSRLHDVFLAAEAMSPGAYRRKGAGLMIRYDWIDGPFGRTLFGATDKGICWLSFNAEGDLEDLKSDWPAAEFDHDPNFIAPLAARAFAFALNKPVDAPIALYAQGTNFQIKVWEALMRLPLGARVTYGDIADVVCTRKASRAVGAAVGANMISVLIPCHRVILASGAIHNYRWGASRKAALLAYEDALCAE
ncbi:MAG: methylated-DNA--[protein]-cysteine S-methyltransferase [Pseudomonadota bacterium]